jgi:hypothetical protein
MTLQIDKDIIMWMNGFVGKSAVLDRVMIILANDYFVPVSISLMLMAIWFLGRNAAERDNYQKSVVCAAISLGSACGLVLACNYLYRHPHPFEDMPQLLDTVNHIFYPIHDPSFPSNTSAITFAAGQAIRCCLLSFRHTGRRSLRNTHRILHPPDRNARPAQANRLGFSDLQEALPRLDS